MSELKPCPFCPDGGNPIKTQSGEEPCVSWYSCRCSQCGASIGLYDTPEEADIAWNTRYEPTCKPNLIERKINFNGETTYRFWQAICECGWIVGEDGTDKLQDFEHVDRYCGGCGAKVVKE